jgi:hypothetical protein
MGFFDDLGERRVMGILLDWETCMLGMKWATHSGTTGMLEKEGCTARDGNCRVASKAER